MRPATSAKAPLDECQGRPSMILLGGRFWGLERILSSLPGTIVTAGYSGGSPDAGGPTYYNLQSTGDAEAVRVDWDPGLVSLADIVAAFAVQSDRDPSPACSTRYRRAVICSSVSQAEAVRRLGIRSEKPFLIEIGMRWTQADNYHQRYYESRYGPLQPEDRPTPYRRPILVS